MGIRMPTRYIRDVAPPPPPPPLLLPELEEDEELELLDDELLLEELELLLEEELDEVETAGVVTLAVADLAETFPAASYAVTEYM